MNPLADLTFVKREVIQMKIIFVYIDALTFSMLALGAITVWYSLVLGIYHYNVLMAYIYI